MVVEAFSRLYGAYRGPTEGHSLSWLKDISLLVVSLLAFASQCMGSSCLVFVMLVLLLMMMLLLLMLQLSVLLLLLMMKLMIMLLIVKPDGE